MIVEWECPTLNWIGYDDEMRNNNLVTRYFNGQLKLS